MKKSVLIFISIISLVIILASCSSSLSGEYVAKDSSENPDTYSFSSGNKVTITSYGIPISGAYTIKDGQMTITGNVFGQMSELASFPFEKKGNSLFIDGVEFVKSSSKTSEETVKVEEAKPTAQENDKVEPVKEVEEEKKNVSEMSTPVEKEVKARVPFETETWTVYIDGDNRIYVIKNDNSLWKYEAGDYDWENDKYTTIATKIADNVISFRANTHGGESVYILKGDHSLWTFGSNYFGQLGDDTGIDRDIPVKILDDVAHINVGNNYVRAIKFDRTLWTWGNNSDYMLLDGTNEMRYAPVKVADNVVRLWGGVIKEDGTLWWRSRDNDFEMSMSDVLKSWSFNNSNFYIRGDNSLWAKGDNSYGQLGNGNTDRIDEPVEILKDVQDVYARDKYTQCLTTDGEFWAWGENGDFQLGDGTRIPRKTPVKIMDNVTAINEHYALKNDGTFWGWTHNIPISANDASEYASPIKIADNVGFIRTNYLIKKDGSLWVWGYDISRFDYLNDGTTENDGKLIKIMDDVKLPSIIKYD